MSALRVPGPTGTILLDPYTRQPYVPAPLDCTGSGPVEIIQPARCPAPAGPPRMKVGALTLVNRQVKGTYIAHLTDDEILGAIATAGSQAAAAEQLGVGQSSLCRRLVQIKAALG